MTIQAKEEITKLLIVAGYGKDLKDILFIEDIELMEVEPIDFEIEPIDFEIEPIEFDELY